MAKHSLWPTDKTRALLDIWSIDLITNMEPVSLEGCHHCIVTIGCFLSEPKYSQSKIKHQSRLQTDSINSYWLTLVNPGGLKLMLGQSSKGLFRVYMIA